MVNKLYVEPDNGISPLIKFIRKSKKFLYINSYLIDDKRILEAVSNAVKRKIDVKIIVDGRPYGINGDDGTHDEIKILKDTKASVKIAPARFEEKNVFDHAKYMLTYNRADIGTLNFTEAAFSKNREYFFITNNRDVIKSLERIFLSDFNNKYAGKDPRKYLIVSPGSELNLQKFIESERKIFIETEEMGDDQNIIDTIMKKGRKARVIVPDTVSSTDISNLKKLKKNGVKIKYMPANKLYMHAKTIIGKKAFIGSENFTKSSLNRNREVGIVLNKHHCVSILKDSFSEDWKNASRRIKKAKYNTLTSKNKSKDYN